MSRSDQIRLVAGGIVTAWALWTAGAVYLVVGGEKQHRLETALLLLVAMIRSADRLGIRLTTRDGVPREAGGVGLFVNGYPEFLARIRVKASPAAP